jgi:hypothetical protein
VGEGEVLRTVGESPHVIYAAPLHSLPPGIPHQPGSQSQDVAYPPAPHPSAGMSPSAEPAPRLCSGRIIPGLSLWPMQAPRHVRYARHNRQSETLCFRRMVIARTNTRNWHG